MCKYSAIVSYQGLWALAPLALPSTSEGTRWVIVAPRRVIATESERKRAEGPLAIEIAEPLETTLRNRLATLQTAREIKDGQISREVSSTTGFITVVGKESYRLQLVSAIEVPQTMTPIANEISIASFIFRLPQ